MTKGACYRPACTGMVVGEVTIILPFPDGREEPLKFPTCEQHEGECGNYLASVLSLTAGRPVICRSRGGVPIIVPPGAENPEDKTDARDAAIKIGRDLCETLLKEPGSKTEAWLAILGVVAGSTQRGTYDKDTVAKLRGVLRKSALDIPDAVLTILVVLADAVTFIVGDLGEDGLWH